MIGAVLLLLMLMMLLVLVLMALLQVAGVITELTRMAMGSAFPFTIVVSDPAGNSFVQVPPPPLSPVPCTPRTSAR